ncbi:MAG TPA: glycine zipper 2TM domain-containing protein [Novosphingobium sp.]|nr:glycine zipper 2TM domain-containing protein [Novosphingobium sp.]HQA16774.1 glycine zipper 2TM domain-containing protein [Novosphingobium sp.]
MSVRPVRLSLLGVTALAFAGPALAQQPSLPPPPPGVVDAQGRVFDGPAPDMRPEWQGAAPQQAMPPMHPGQPRSYPPGWEQARADWLVECRRRQGHGKTVGGAVIGGVIGGVVGNRVAGHGNRTEGTIAGAAVGAVAGAAIGSGADRRAAQDYCEAYLEQHTTWGPGYGYGQPVVGYGYAPMTVMVPVAYVAAAAPAQPRECVETVVTEEWVAAPTRTRYVPPRPKPRPKAVPDKRVKIVPDKRVRVN